MGQVRIRRGGGGSATITNNNPPVSTAVLLPLLPAYTAYLTTAAAVPDDTAPTDAQFTAAAGAPPKDKDHFIVTRDNGREETYIRGAAANSWAKTKTDDPTLNTPANTVALDFRKAPARGDSVRDLEPSPAEYPTPGVQARSLITLADGTEELWTFETGSWSLEERREPGVPNAAFDARITALEAEDVAQQGEDTALAARVAALEAIPADDDSALALKTELHDGAAQDAAIALNTAARHDGAAQDAAIAANTAANALDATHRAGANDGAAGHVVAGGTTGQVYQKNGPTDGDAVWGDPAILNEANVIAGAGAPTAGDGADGQYWRQLDAAPGSKMVWGPKAAGAWPAQADFFDVPTVEPSLFISAPFDATAHMSAMPDKTSIRLINESPFSGQTVTVPAGTRRLDISGTGGVGLVGGAGVALGPLQACVIQKDSPSWAVGVFRTRDRGIHTLAELRALPSNGFVHGDHVNTSDTLYAYIWSATSTATDDGVKFLQPDDAPAVGRWHLIGPADDPLNPVLFPTGDFAALKVNDGDAGANGAQYVFEPTANVTIDTTGMLAGERFKVTTDWAARLAEIPIPTWDTVAGVGFKAGHAFPNSGHEWVDIIFDGTDLQIRASSDGAPAVDTQLTQAGVIAVNVVGPQDAGTTGLVFPTPFATPPVISLTHSHVAGAQWIDNVTFGTVTTTGIDLLKAVGVDGITAGQVNVHWTARGDRV